MPDHFADFCASVLLVSAVVGGGLLVMFVNWWLVSGFLRWLLDIVNNC